jgi:phosphoribosyl 1,2-cyclic phosphodiesterase
LNSVRVTSLGSGSKGNATVIEYAQTRILIDCGFSCKALEARLLNRGIHARQITAVLVTHEHSDHFNGVPTFANRYQIPVWMSHGTSLFERAAKIQNVQVFNSHQSFHVADVEITPVLVPHDAREACQFVVNAGKHRVGILTDLGHITPYVSNLYQHCHMLMLEFNHDREMLMAGRYPPALKARVSGSLGHLSNEQALEFLQFNDLSQLQYLAAMHLSEENNRVSLVSELIAAAGLADSTQVVLAEQESGFDWLTLSN